MVKKTLKQLGKRFKSVYIVSPEHLDLLEHRTTTSAAKPVSILCVIADDRRDDR